MAAPNGNDFLAHLLAGGEETIDPSTKERLFKKAWMGAATYRDLEMLAPLLGFGSAQHLLQSGQARVDGHEGGYEEGGQVVGGQTLYRVYSPSEIYGEPLRQVTDPDEMRRLRKRGR